MERTQPSNVEQRAPLGVYVSVPFCRAKCSFCNFASGVSSAAFIEGYIADLCNEIAGARMMAEQLQLNLPRMVDTVYLGGGTPSLLEPAQLRRIFAELRRQFDLDSTTEITLEAAPGQISDALLSEAQTLGVNRISLGVQSFVDRECAAVGRTHTHRDCIQEIIRLQSAGVGNVNVDLIAGLPYQTPESWQHSLEVATSIGLAHISVYMLEVDEDSRLGREIISGGDRVHARAVPRDEALAAFYETACELLPSHGFPQYEISNFAMPQHQSKHNLKYWRRKPYIGFGLDAHSMLHSNSGATRFANSADFAEYAASLHDRSTTDITTQAAFEETIFLGLRLNSGITVSQLMSEFSPEMVLPIQFSVQDLVRERFMTDQDGVWRLTSSGRLISNDVFTNLLLSVAA